jgi:L-aminopeptidase/D-esterase-like protein
MQDAITDVPGILVGHAEYREGGTGCTVVMCEGEVVGAVDVRGGAPATREIDCLEPTTLVERVHAVLIAGGSAFGLEAATGVVRYLEERGIGYDVGVTHVPIVPAACLIDLAVGSPTVRPDAALGYAACRAGSNEPPAQGNRGAGTGGTIGPKFVGHARQMKSGVGTASVSMGDLVVGAIVALNPFGDVVDPSTGEIVAGTLNTSHDGFLVARNLFAEMAAGHTALSTNTCLAVVATNARLDKARARRVAIMGHDGIGRAVVPAHTLADGDTVFCLATGTVEADTSHVGTLAAEVVARAIVKGVKAAESAYGIAGYREIQERFAMAKGR